MTRHISSTALQKSDVNAIIDYICSVAHRQEIFYLWRPILRDPGDDHVLELAVAAGCDAIVTHDVRAFAAAGRFAVRVLAPGVFLNQLRGTK